jgi:hypothetical protein
MRALDYQHAKIWFDIIAGWQANREVDEKLGAMDQKARENAWSDPSYGTYRLTKEYKARAAAIEAHRKFVDEGSSRVRLDPAKIFKADITAPQQWNVDTEHRFRTWAVEYFSSKPLEVTTRVSPGRRKSSRTWSSVRPLRRMPLAFSARITSQPGGLQRASLQAEVLIDCRDAGIAIGWHGGRPSQKLLDVPRVCVRMPQLY